MSSSAVDETQKIIHITENPKTDQLLKGTGRDGDHSFTLIPSDTGGTRAKPSDVTAFKDPLGWGVIVELLFATKSEEAHQVAKRKDLMDSERNRALILGVEKRYGEMDEETDEEIDNETDKNMGNQEVCNDLASQSTGFGSLSRGLCDPTVHQPVLQPISAVQIDIGEGREQLESYKNNIQSRFPILQENWLKWLRQEMSAFLTKDSVLPKDNSAHNSNVFPPLRGREPVTAIILLVLALGKICDWQAPFPELRLIEVRNLRRKGLVDGDLIPGLPFYAEATRILGISHGSNALCLIRAQILAALYASLAGYVYKSSYWIDEACKRCHIHVPKWV